jgi:SAM-dependent methyltransferase
MLVFQSEFDQKQKVTVGMDLENEKRTWWQFLILWIVSGFACVSNCLISIPIKITHFRTPWKNIFWGMGRSEKHISSLFFDRFSKWLHRVKIHSASWGSLDLFYNYHEKVVPRLNDDLEGILTDFWMNIENRQAVRNRLLMVIAELEKAFIESFERDGEVRILSIASGSAQAVIEAIKRVPWIPVKAVLIDMDPTALDYAKKQAEEAGMVHCFKFVRGKTDLIEQEAFELKPNIIEMVGFLDYRNDDQAIKLFQRIRALLPKGGFFLTCNINKNPEEIFLNWVLLWRMIYRTKEQVQSLLENGGFHKSKVFYEPLKIHSIAVCRV